MSASTAEHTCVASTDMRLKGDGKTITNLKPAMTQRYRLIKNVSEDETEVRLVCQEGHSCYKCSEKSHVAKKNSKKKKKLELKLI